MAQRLDVDPRSRAFDELVGLIDGVPWMSRDQGWRVWEHFRTNRPVDVLDIGTCYGTSAAYMAGALRENGSGGRVVTVDSALFDDQADVKIWCQALWEKCGLTDMIEPVRITHSNYAWWLAEQVRRQTGPDCVCEPLFDFVYLDGAKWLPLDGVSVVLIATLLRPGGWLLMDDLDWRYANAGDGLPVVTQGENAYPLSQKEIDTPHLRVVFDNVVRNHPSFTEFVDQGVWGWAKKGEQGAVKTVTKQEWVLPPGVSRLAAIRRAATAIIRGSGRH